jgi:fluoroquinolone transport system permease protein
LAALAQNKVQGLALMKAAGIVLVPPLIAYFLPAGWQIPLALTPTWWPAQTLWQLQRGAPEWWLLLIGGFFYQTMLLRWLVRRFDKTMHQ